MEYLATLKNNNAGWFSPDRLPDQQTEIGTTVTMAPDPVSLGFRVGSLHFLITADIFCEVIQRPLVNPIPSVEPWFNGLLNLRGNVIPVIDLLLFMSGTGSSNGKRQLLAIDKGEKTIAIWIDGYPEIVYSSLTQSTVLPELPEPLQHITTGAVLHNNQVWLNVRLSELFKTLGNKYT